MSVLRAGRAAAAGGILVGTVLRVAGGAAFVEIAELGGFEYGPCPYPPLDPPLAGDTVACAFEPDGDSLVVLARLGPARPVSGVVAGPAGPAGPPGGPPGLDAYQIAVEAGFGGDVREWLASLVGRPGDRGPGWRRGVATSRVAGLGTDRTATFDVPLAAGYRLLSITVSGPARVRLYVSAAHRAADEGRPVGVDPVGDHGLVLEFVSTAGLLSASLSPVVDGYCPTGTAAKAAVTNLSSPAPIILDLEWIRTE